MPQPKRIEQLNSRAPRRIWRHSNALPHVPVLVYDIDSGVILSPPPCANPLSAVCKSNEITCSAETETCFTFVTCCEGLKCQVNNGVSGESGRARPSPACALLKISVSSCVFVPIPRMVVKITPAFCCWIGILCVVCTAGTASSYRYLTSHVR